MPSSAEVLKFVFYTSQNKTGVYSFLHCDSMSFQALLSICSPCTYSRIKA